MGEGKGGDIPLLLGFSMLSKLREAISTLAAFRQDVILLRNQLSNVQAAMKAHQDDMDAIIVRQVALESQMKTTGLEQAELYGKTYKLLKRMQMEDHTQTEAEPDIEPGDPVTARVMARRNRGLPG